MNWLVELFKKVEGPEASPKGLANYIEAEYNYRAETSGKSMSSARLEVIRSVAENFAEESDKSAEFLTGALEQWHRINYMEDEGGKLPTDHKGQRRIPPGKLTNETEGEK